MKFQASFAEGVMNPFFFESFREKGIFFLYQKANSNVGLCTIVQVCG